MEQKRANDARRTITHSPGPESLPRSNNLRIRGAAMDEPPSPLPALASRVSTPQGRKLAVAGTVCALSVTAASLLTLRPLARTRPSTPEMLPVSSGRQLSAPAQATYSVRVGPYHEPRAVLLAHKRLLWLGLKPLLVRSADGTYLRVPTGPTEREATRVARGLKEQGYTTLVVETTPEAALSRGKSADPKYHVDGVLVGFEGGQTKGWDGAGSVTSLRNSSLFSFQGEHSLEVSLGKLTPELPGQLRFKPESVVLPQDVFVAQALLPKAASVRIGVRWYVLDANGKVTRTSALPLRTGKWIATRLTILPQVALPIQELGLEVVSPRSPYSGIVYVDNVEQQRAR
jgi:hypothetical protein